MHSWTSIRSEGPLGSLWSKGVVDFQFELAWFKHTSNRAEVVQRLLAGRCELCGIKGEPVQVHHVRKLADLERMGKGRPYWAQIMLKRRRKTLIVCQACHHTIHQE